MSHGVKIDGTNYEISKRKVIISDTRYTINKRETHIDGV